MRRNWRDAPRPRASCMVRVHGRTRCQFFQGQADWAAIGAVKAAVSIPVVANGDCDSLADAAAMIGGIRRRCGDDRPRGVGRPWLVGEVAHTLRPASRRAAPRGAQSRARSSITRLCSNILACRRVSRHARKHLAAYAAHSPGCLMPASSPDAGHERAIRTPSDPCSLALRPGPAEAA